MLMNRIKNYEIIDYINIDKLYSKKNNQLIEFNAFNQKFIN